jgi:hypothetical protein
LVEDFLFNVQAGSRIADLTRVAKIAIAAAGIATSKSLSAKTTLGDLPASSRVSRFKFPAAA